MTAPAVNNDIKTLDRIRADNTLMGDMNKILGMALKN